ncbi:hypothetical protein NL676_024780 [Syzygium grande]|nr:hypothetical protein NL676_024780 [Syzygium grande]
MKPPPPFHIIISKTPKSVASKRPGPVNSDPAPRSIDAPGAPPGSAAMEAEVPVTFAYVGRNFAAALDDCSTSTTSTSSTSAFSDCGSDRSGEFPTASSQDNRRRLLMACASDDSDDLIRQLVLDLDSCCLDEQKQAALEIRLLAKNKPENRVRIAQAGAIKPLVALISSSDPQVQEYGVTAILNLSLCDENKELIAASGAIKPLVRALRTGTPTAKENAACALLRLSQIEENKAAIGRSGAIPLLVSLLETGGSRGKKDASTALYSLCSAKENKVRAVEAGAMRPLLELMADLGSSMVDKAAFVVSALVGAAEARAALVEEGGIPVLVEMVEVGTQRQKEIAVVVLLQLCEDSVAYRAMVAREGAIPPLVALSQSGTNRGKQKAETLIQLLRQPRSGDAAARTSEASVSEGTPTNRHMLTGGLASQPDGATRPVLIGRLASPPYGLVIHVSMSRDGLLADGCFTYNYGFGFSHCFFFSSRNKEDFVNIM